MKRNNTYWNDIARHVAGEMDPDNNRKLHSEAAHDPQLKNDLELMKRTWQQFNARPDDRYNDTGKAWAKLNERMENDGLMEEQIPVKNLYNMQYILRIAAVILVILAVGIPTVFYSVNQANNRELMNYTAKEGILTVDLPDGSRVFLNEGAHLKLQNDFEKERNVSLKGEGFFDVLSDPNRPFRVNSGKVTVTVLGTSFNVRETEKSTVEVFVESGKVRMDLPDLDEGITLGPGQLGTANGKLAAAELSDDNYLSWKTRDFKFVDESVENILKVLEKAYHVEVNTEDIDDSGLRLTTTYSDQSFEAILNTICTALNIHFEKEGKVYILHAN